jgi:FkbM family methyltransferase
MKTLNEALWLIIIFLHRHRIRGTARLFSILGKSLNCEPLVVYIGPNGVKYCVTPRHYIDSEVIRTGYYEQEILEALMGRLRSNDVFWDIGSNFGLHSIAVARLRRDCKVIAFEPNPEMVSRILRNAGLNGIQVTIVPAGVWSKSCMESFCNENQINPGMASLGGAELEESSSQPLRILCHSGDDYVDKLGISAPNVIKIDTEGAESKVIEGLLGTIRNGSVHTIIFEERRLDSEAKGQLVRDQLAIYGYVVERLGADHGGGHCNWIAKRIGS